METSENIIKTSDTLRTLRQVSLVFFLIIGTLHLISGLMVSQSQLLPISNIINRVLDIPFALIGTVLALSQAKISSDSGSRKTYFLIMIIISLLVLGLMLYITLFLPDKTY